MKTIVFILLFLFVRNAQAQINGYTLLVGPKLNFNFGNNEHRFSGGLEISAWMTGDLPLPISIDAGVDFEKDRIRLYSELQAGMILGLSAGPVIEFTREGHTVGFQGSGWAAFFLGTDFRYRRINKTNYFAPGLFFKIPVKTTENWIG
jgi:hypothetical protein